jgi:hypothetical protein
MSTFSRVNSKDYQRKKNVLQNNATDALRSKRSRLVAGDGTLPRSNKYRDWSCKVDCKKLHKADRKTGEVLHKYKKA